MKKLFYLSFMLFVLMCSCNKEDSKEIENQVKDELTIYDKNGNAVAYCNYSKENETIIYLWDGKPTAYYTSERDELIYGFNGKFLGWRESGIFYDLEGKRIGFEKGACNIITSIEPIKHIKEIMPIKSIKETPPVRPINSLDWSTVQLDVFFLKGIKKE
ncbi:4-fold beta flower protein [Marinifilum sp. D737]|uniref:4-fold beta flower protein n=1 Tax=Marinifilum sp. D737 TaxID=2969628 RepID=UPI0022756379|nr:hypothetical protein [Marinifilum sp. D737]MCY1635496.1 hypothetical protein [Marinifilum sp. D737]